MKRRHPEQRGARVAQGREAEGAAGALPLPLDAALDAAARHRASGEPLDRALEQTVRARRLGPRERRAAGDIVFRWARWRTAAEAALDAALKDAGGRAPSRRDRDLAAMLLSESTAGELAFDPERALARLAAPLDALLPALIASGLGAPALPAWLREALARSGEDVDALSAALAAPAPLVLACDIRHVGLDDVLSTTSGTPSPVVRGAVRLPPRTRIPDSLKPHVWPMDDGSQAVARAVAAATGEHVLDLCAGGGGKSRLLSTTGAHVLATDVNARRLDEAPAAVARVVADGRNPPFRAGVFDKVLVDAPCTGTGTLRRAPDLAHRLRPEDVAHFTPLQRELLAAALALVKPGGLVVYATCSLLREENEDVINATLAAHPRARLTPLKDLWRDAVHIDDGGAGMARLSPIRHGTDGFFIAALRAPE